MDFLAPIVTRRVDSWEGFLREKVTFSFDGELVDTYLALPHSLPRRQTPPFPCIIGMHGFTGSKGEWFDMDLYTKGGNLVKRLLSEGYAIFSADGVLHGERHQRLFPGSVKDTEVGYRTYREYLQARFDRVFYSTLAEYDFHIRYLLGRPEIASDRMAVMGYSLGGHWAYGLLHRCEHIRAIATMVYYPNEKIEPFLVPRGAGMDICLVPKLMLFATNDDYQEDLTPIREFLDANRHHGIDTLYFDSDHSLPVDYVTPVVAWFTRRFPPVENERGA